MDLTKLTRLQRDADLRLVVSPSASVRWREGKTLISSTGRGAAIETNDATALRVLQAFAAPRAVRDVVDEFKATGESFPFSWVVALWEIDALAVADEVAEVPHGADSAASQVEGLTGDADVSAEMSHTRAQASAQASAQLIREIACDMGGFGASLYQETDGIKLLARLSQVGRALAAVASELRERRAPYLAAQLARLNISGATRGLKLQLGSGATRPEGWLNIDFPPADVGLHLGWGLPFADGVADHVYLSHVLEHLYREEALALLKEAQRVLSPTGVVRVVVPDIEKCLRAYAAGDEDFFETRKKFWTRTRTFQTPLEHLLKNAGAGIKPGKFWGHKYAYDFPTLELLLHEAGFAHVARSEFMQSAHPELLIDDKGKTTGFKHGDAYYSLFVEATKGSSR
ncbi:MAG TPA: methyltransferase domain-containing protein [Pyrinomonadaceae bacterium]|jgi:SAM-dependent methyltransferase|nr:methyltransferase domain-containing protein [Pyrinomonadaceae bacterium]